MKKIILFLSVLLSAAFGISAQEIRVEKAQLPAKVPFAQPFEAVYTLSHTPGYDVIIDEKTLPADFKITQAVFTRQSPQTGEYRLTAIPFVLNKSTFTITFLLQQNDQTAAQVLSEQPISVEKVATFNDKKLREIRSPRIPPAWWRWLVFVVLGAILFFLIRSLRKQMAQQALSIQYQEDHRPCEEIAFSKIDALLNSGLWERKEYRVFYFTLSDILREYLWRRFQMDTSADTSAELLRHAKTIPALQPLLPSIKEFLNSSDLVKFAKDEPTEQRRNQDVTDLRTIVRDTTPAPQEQAQ